MWNGETSGLTAAAFVVGAASFASRLVGVLRDRTLASAFGAGQSLDVYYAAFRLPDLFYTLIILGALSAGFIPVFAEYIETKSKDEAWRLAEHTLSVVGFVMIVVSAGLFLFAPALVPMTVPGFSPENLELTISLTRIMALSPLFFGISAVMGGVLQVMRRFLVFSLAPVLYNIGIIFGAIVFVPMLGIQGLAWGVVFGAFMHMLAQASVALRLGFRRIPFPSIRVPGIRRILYLMLPRTAGLAVTQVNLVILLALASVLSEGSIAVFHLANNLQSFPVSLFGISFSVAAFPSLARAAGAKRDEEFNELLTSSVRKILFLLIPSTAVFILLRAQIVRLALGAGVFGWTDTIRTADVLGVFAASLLVQGLVPLFARAFYAIQDTWTPLIAGLIAEGFNLLLALILRESFGIIGLAIAFSSAAYLNLILLWLLLAYKRGAIGQGTLLMSIAKSTAASFALFGFGWIARQAIGTLFPLRTFWQVALQATGTLVIGVGAFLIVAHLVDSHELKEFRMALKKRLLKKAVVQGAEEAQGVGMD